MLCLPVSSVWGSVYVSLRSICVVSDGGCTSSPFESDTHHTPHLRLCSHLVIDRNNFLISFPFPFLVPERSNISCVQSPVVYLRCACLPRGTVLSTHRTRASSRGSCRSS